MAELVKGSDLPSVYNWYLQTVACIKSSNQRKVFKFLRLTLVAHVINVTSEPFPWLILNRSRKTCLALQCIGVVVCSAAFFHKSKFILKTVYWNPPKMSLQETFDINYYCCYHRYCTYCTSFNVDIKRFHII